MRVPLLLLLAAALPALADSRFQVRRMTRDDVPIGKGQCDIRLQVDSEVEVTVRGDIVSIRTLAGQEARDDGSECNAPLPNRSLQDFNFEVRDSRNDIRLIAPPAPRNGYAALVHIRDGSGGFGRYHFRLTWAMAGVDYRNSPAGGFGGQGPGGGPGFAWNNTLNFRGNGRGEAWLNDFGPTRLGEVNIAVDRGARIVAWFRTQRGRGLTFNGSVVAREGDRWKADVMTDDRRYRGTLWFTADPGGNLVSLSTEVTDGRDRMQVNWNRR